ncbi:sugar ABC transporter permease [Paenibacillus sp.]|uniref:carbohydrate ABC transporter permease n=1 Tax=Paenibacillus sp. TaxID=58172 RepID=UPI002D72C16C|nr:sugar ABC transporter permease [Paenibacillus sp.]HZG57782.1 sugar ABC transporter permease [Paenibacillus sp.]
MKHRYIYLCLLPSFAFVGLFLVYPAFEAFRISLYDWTMRNYYNPSFSGFQNYVDALRDPVFLNSFWILAIFLAWMIVVIQAFAVIGAYWVYLLGDSKAGAFFKTGFVVPMVVPGMVLTLFWLFFYEPNFGMLNTLLTMLGLESWTKVWLGDSQATALGALLFKGFPFIGGMGFLIYLAGFQSIDGSLYEAARMDGAKGWQLFKSISLPLIIPQLKLTTLLTLIGGIQQFSDQYILTKGGPGFDTTVPGLYMFNQAFVYGKLGVGSAVGVILFFIIIAFSMANQFLIKKKA